MCPQRGTGPVFVTARAFGYALVPAIALGTLVAVLVVYPRVFSLIERDHVDNALDRVTSLVEAGRLERAERVAAYAAARRPYDPEKWASLAMVRAKRHDAAGVSEAAGHAVSIRQTADGVPTRRPRFHSAARVQLAARAKDRGDEAAAAAHFEYARRFSPWARDELASHADIYATPQRAAALRGELASLGGEPLEWVTLQAIRQYRPWEPCQVQTVRMGLHGDGRVETEWTWARDGGAPVLEPLPAAMNEYAEDILARLENGASVGDVEAISLGIPGWETTPHLWHEGSRARLEPGDGARIVIERDGAPGNAMLNTLPIPAEGAVFVAIRLRAEGAPASVAWIAEDGRERESFRDTFDPIPPGDWTWRAAYHPASHHWDATWLQVGLFDAAGKVTIDRVIILPLRGDFLACVE